MLDAKLKNEQAESASLDDESSRSFNASDIAKMQAYRDALPAVTTAFVLYPGDEAAQFVLAGPKPGAVGAIPLAATSASSSTSVLSLVGNLTPVLVPHDALARSSERRRPIEMRERSRPYAIIRSVQASRVMPGRRKRGPP